ncbi:Ail/Lom family outer membrane beta-barrel protein [Proteus hauseri]|uniref:Ail/Lom family outer membrane beta-barrel protein n=1 Tax=Proteus hauseri TaxID=183417 RepID=UPI0032DABD6D
MKLKLFISSSIIIVFSTLSFNAFASLKNTVSVGYAQSGLKVDGVKSKQDPRGFNLKYHREIGNGFGIIGSFSYNKRAYEQSASDNLTTELDLSYYLLSTGPSYRFNQYINLYGLVGMSSMSAKVNKHNTNMRSKEEATEFSNSYGVGMQFNPLPYLAVDASYEYSQIAGINFGTWVFGVGYRF